MTKEIKGDPAELDRNVDTADLSDAIEGTVDKEPDEEVRSVRVFGNHYRCNWWVRDKSLGPAYLNLGTISRSKFLRATMTGEKLVIEDLSHPGSNS